jgi:hypothetical protein
MLRELARARRGDHPRKTRPAWYGAEMSTRGVVAFGDATRWEGVYNHSDSGPEMLGRDVWSVIETTGTSVENLEDAYLAARRQMLRDEA